METKTWHEIVNRGYLLSEVDLDILAPPCKTCKHFQPQAQFVQTRGGFRSEGIKLCWSNQMYADFSCYEFKGDSSK